MTEFPAAPLDTASKIITGFTVAILSLVPAWLLVMLEGAYAVPLVVGYGAIMTLTWAMSPAGYALEGRALNVTRRAWRPFQAADVTLAEVENPRRMGVRAGGSGGAFGYWGRFWRRDLKFYRAYLTTRDAEQIVSVTTDRGVVLLSPEDPKALRRALKGRA